MTEQPPKTPEELKLEELCRAVEDKLRNGSKRFVKKRLKATSLRALDDRDAQGDK